MADDFQTPEETDEGSDDMTKCYGVLPLCLKTDATPHHHCPMSIKCTFVSFDEASVQEHIEKCSVKPFSIPEESYLICSKVQAFCLSGQDKAKKSPGQKHYHCAGYPECMHINSRLNALKTHIFTCDKLAKRLDLYPVCSELACRHQYDETKFHYHCGNCEWTSPGLEEAQNHRSECFPAKEAMSDGEYPVLAPAEELGQRVHYPVIIALVSNDDSVLINLQPCSKKGCMKKIDITKDREHYHCLACEFCAVEQSEVLEHFNHLHYNSVSTHEDPPVFEECFALDVSCCAEKRVEKSKTIMSAVMHYHCPKCKEFSDCTLAVVKLHHASCDLDQALSPLKQISKRAKTSHGEIEVFDSEYIITEFVEPSASSFVPKHDKFEKLDIQNDYDHNVITCSNEWAGCAVNRGTDLIHYHCPYCTWASSLLVNIEAHMPGCVEKLTLRYQYGTYNDETKPNDYSGYESPVEYPIIDYSSRQYLSIIPCFKRAEGCSRAGIKFCIKSTKVHWHCPICTVSAGKVAMEKHFVTCAGRLNSVTDMETLDYSSEEVTRRKMAPESMRNSDSEDSDFEFNDSFDTPESLSNVLKCYKKLSACGVDDVPGRPVHYHCSICAKPDLNRIKIEQHQVMGCLRSRANALRHNVDPNDAKYKNPPNVILCRQRDASCNTIDSKRVTHFHCSVCSYVSYRKDRAENHVQKCHLKKAKHKLCNINFKSESKSPTKAQFNDSQLSGSADPCDELMVRCDQDIGLCKFGRKSDPRRRAHWHCNRCNFVDYKRYRIKCHIEKNHLDTNFMLIKPDTADQLDIERFSSDEEEDEIAGIFSCVNNSGACSIKSRVNNSKKHWHCSLCSYWGSTKSKAFDHYVKCLHQGRKGNRGSSYILSKTKEFLNPVGSRCMDDIDMFQDPKYSNSAPLIFCNNNVFQCTFPLNTRIDDHGLLQHWHCPICDKVGFTEVEGLKHYVQCSNCVEVHVKSQVPGFIVDLDVLQCGKDIQDCNPTRKGEVRRQTHFHCPLCPYVDYRKARVDSHFADICCGKAASTHIMYCTADIDKCSSQTKDPRPGYFGHWHCSLCTYLDYNKRKVAKHYRDCFVINQKYGSTYGFESDQEELNAINQTTSDSMIRYPDIAHLSEKELNLLKIIPCSRRLHGCETGSMNLEDQPLHYHCPVCTRSDYLQKMIRHFPRCLKYLDKKRKSASFKGINDLHQRKKKKYTKMEIKKIRTEGLGCEVIDKNNGIFVVRGSAVGLGFPSHVIFKKTHPKEFHCESGCEMQDRQLCKHLSAVEKFVREKDLFKEDHSEIEFVDMNADFPDLDQVELFHRLTDEEKCDVYTLHNYCLDNNTPVIRSFQTFKYSDGEETSCTFYSVCSAMFKGYYTRSGRVITTYNKKTQKYLCKCFYKECVHTTITKIFRASLGLIDQSPLEDQVTATHNPNNTSLNSSNDNFLDNLYEDCEDKRFLKIVHCDL